MSRKSSELIPKSGWLPIYNILKNLYISSFKWEVPETVNQRFLELSLFDYGKVAFFKDEYIGHLVLRCVNAGQLDQYYEAKKIRVYGGSGYQKQLENHKNSVIIFNTEMRDTPVIRIMDYAKRIYNMEKTIDINIQAQKTPIAIKCSKKQEFTMKNLYNQYDEFQPVIFVDDDMDLNKFECIQTKAEFVADEIEEQKRKLWNEALSFIGIENNFSEKNERLTANEVLISNGLAIANRNSRLQAREKACDEINKLFPGINVSVKSNILSVLEFEMNENTNQVKEGAENE